MLETIRNNAGLLIGVPLMRRTRPRISKNRGQAPAVSVAILTAAVLVLALALYAYFSGYYSILNRKQSLLSYMGSVSSSIDGYIEYYTYNTSNGYYVYCFIIALKNSNPGSYLNVYLSVLPIGRSTADTIMVSSVLSKIPINIDSTPPERTVFVFNVSDANSNGFVDLIGVSSTTNQEAILVELKRPISCIDIASNQTILNNDLRPTYASPSTIYLDTDNSLNVFAQGLGITNLQDIPLWNIRFKALEKHNLFIIIKSPVQVNYMSLSLFVLFDGKYYLSYLIPLVK